MELRALVVFAHLSLKRIGVRVRLVKTVMVILTYSTSKNYGVLDVAVCLVKRVVPEWDSIGPDLVRVDQTVVKFSSIVECFMEQENEGSPRGWIIIRCSPGDNWDLMSRLN